MSKNGIIEQQEADIKRLHAKLEKAEMERDDARDYAQSWRNLARKELIDSENWKLNSSEWKRTSEAWQIFAMQMCDECDEARQVARKLYREIERLKTEFTVCCRCGHTAKEHTDFKCTHSERVQPPPGFDGADAHCMCMLTREDVLKGGE